jgi:hypothetical protein
MGRGWLGIGLCALLAMACSSPPDALRAERALSRFEPAALKRARRQARPADRRARRAGKRRFGEARVYVDGRVRAMLRYRELPPSLRTRWQRLEEGREVRRFSFVEYLAALGVDVARVRQLHLYGGRERVAIVDGAELRRLGDDLRFSFTRGDGGKPRVEAPEQGMRANTSIDKIANLAVYVEREPPRFDGKRRRFVRSDGSFFEGIPYAEGERHGGTRVYLDGQLLGSVRRRQLAAELVRGEPGGQAPTYALERYLRSLGVEPQRVSRVQLVDRRDRVAADVHLAAQHLDRAFDFRVPAHSRGRIVIDQLAPNQRLSSVLLYDRLSPAARQQPADDRRAAQRERQL